MQERIDVLSISDARHGVRLTPRERDILLEILYGCTNREIAARLGLREQTVRNALSVIYSKFEVCTRLQLARVAGALGNG